MAFIFVLLLFIILMLVIAVATIAYVYHRNKMQEIQESDVRFVIGKLNQNTNNKNVDSRLSGQSNGAEEIIAKFKAQDEQKDREAYQSSKAGYQKNSSGNNYYNNRQNQAVSQQNISGNNSYYTGNYNNAVSSNAANNNNVGSASMNNNTYNQNAINYSGAYANNQRQNYGVNPNINNNSGMNTNSNGYGYNQSNTMYNNNQMYYGGNNQTGTSQASQVLSQSDMPEDTLTAPVVSPVSAERQPVVVHKQLEAEFISSDKADEQISSPDVTEKPAEETTNIQVNDESCSVKEMFKLVRSLRESGADYLQYNVATARLDLVSDEESAYILTPEGDVLPNCIVTFNAQDLNERVYECDINEINSDNRIIYCKVDGMYNIIRRGKII